MGSRLSPVSAEEERRPGARTERGCALVTGASRGIGAAIAKGLAEDGWAVGVNYRQDAEGAEAVVAEIRSTGAEAVPVCADVSEPGAADRIWPQLEDELGRPVLVLVNNAAIAVNGIALRLDDAAWQTVIETNLSAVHRLIRRALPPMLRENFGRVVNVSSVAASHPSQGQANYVASKAGLIGLTKAVAVEVASRSVTVNAIAPGLIETDAGREAAGAVQVPIPAGRLGTPEEVAACARFLVSERASYVTGSVLTVDGGATA